jgi:predicted nucleic acid-binding protein
VTLNSLITALGDAERILLDSSTLIAYHTPLESAHPLAKHLVDRVLAPKDPLRGYCSAITASELLIRPIRTGGEEQAFMHNFLTDHPKLIFLPTDLFVATTAATLRSTTNTRLPDALIVATGLLAGCEVIVSNDERWKRRFEPLFPQFQWLYLGDHLPA